MLTVMKRIRNPELKRRQIIEAALKILREGHFLTRFSLDSVAQEAGVSKGGLMHHYPSKDALLEGVTAAVIERFEERVSQGLEAEPLGTPGRLLRSYVRAVLGEEGAALADISPVLLSYTGTLEGLGSRFDYWQRLMAADGVDPVEAAMIRLTVDGLLYTEMIDGRPIDPKLRNAIRERLLTRLENLRFTVDD